VHEGGISTPLIAHWPQRIRTPGALRHSPGHVIDLVPTLLEIAGISPQTQTDSAAPQLPGKSLVNALADDVIVPREFLWWLHEGNRAIRQGNWKLVAAREDPWELYDLTTDRAESHDLASQHPEQVKSLAELWQRQFDETLALAKQTRELGFPPTAKGKKPAAPKPKK
jgi:arylsulfatase